MLEGTIIGPLGILGKAAPRKLSAVQVIADTVTAEALFGAAGVGASAILQVLLFFAFHVVMVSFSCRSAACPVRCSGVPPATVPEVTTEIRSASMAISRSCVPATFGLPMLPLFAGGQGFFLTLPCFSVTVQDKKRMDVQMLHPAEAIPAGNWERSYQQNEL
jgi:hypothetical protein